MFGVQQATTHADRLLAVIPLVSLTDRRPAQANLSRLQLPFVGLRADENRTGYISTKPNILAVYRFQATGWCGPISSASLKTRAWGFRPT
jgi:hypothetical protein